MEYVKFGSELPEAIHAQFRELAYGEKRITLAGALLWYFNADPEVQRLYREWARALVEDFATVDQAPETVRAAIKKRPSTSPRRRRKGK